jgi:hypothetical protein
VVAVLNADTVVEAELRRPCSTGRLRGSPRRGRPAARNLTAPPIRRPVRCRRSRSHRPRRRRPRKPDNRHRPLSTRRQPVGAAAGRLAVGAAIWPCRAARRRRRMGRALLMYLEDLTCLWPAADGTSPTSPRSSTTSRGSTASPLPMLLEYPPPSLRFRCGSTYAALLPRPPRSSRRRPPWAQAWRARGRWRARD